MIRASDIVLSIRQKLNDKDTARYKYTTPEVVDAINLALVTISNDILFFNRIWTIRCNEKRERYELPADFVKLIRAKLNGKEIECVKSLDTKNTSNSITIDNISIRINGKVKTDDLIEIEYYYIEHINDENSSLNISMLLYEPIIFYATAILFQNPINKDGLQKSSYYMNLYQNKMIDAKGRLKSNQQSKKIMTKFKRV